jgi:hypothetical protein
VSALGPLGFLLVMLGFGLRLDTDWQGTAWVLLAAGAAAVAIAAAHRLGAPRAFVSTEGGE